MVPWTRVSKVGLLISQLLLDGWVGERKGDSGRMNRAYLVLVWLSTCQSDKALLVNGIRKSFCTARRVTTTISAKPEVFLIDSPPRVRLISLKTTSII